jgi:glyoxylase-like metal-dependent hydrolase (beta-lactamase superfamily II)
MNHVQEIAPEVVRVSAHIANCYLIGTRDEWVLIDTGTEGSANRILEIAEQSFGKDTRPQAIVLTHGHFDHSGSAGELADLWDLPILAHRLEMPYLTGKSKYPPPDPTVGGFMAQLVRFFPNKAYDYGDRVQELEDELEAIGMRGWELIETPGHSPGHVSFFRDEDGVLLAGDAFATIDQRSAYKMMTKKPEVSLPPNYYTCDWSAAHESVKELAGLRPRVIGAGHGEPMSGREAREGLRRLAKEWPMPKHGRYVKQPAVADEDGVQYLPPPVADPVKWIGIAAVAAGTAGAAAYWKSRKAA